MIDRFLRAKHWHLFLPTFILPMFLQFIIMGSMFAGSINGQPDQHFISNYMGISYIISLLVMFVVWGWFWSIAIGLQAKVPHGVKMKVTKFKFFFFLPLIYIVFFMYSFNNAFMGNWVDLGFFAIIFPLHLFSMFCIFYTIYFVAKTFKTVELQRATKFSDFAGEFFLVWFFPIGVWILQPKINQMVKERHL